jgi:hypothetical protein
MQQAGPLTFPFALVETERVPHPTLSDDRERWGDRLGTHALVEQRAVTAPESRAPVAPAGYGVGMSQVPRHTTEASWHSYVHAS